MYTILIRSLVTTALALTCVANTSVTSGCTEVGLDFDSIMSGICQDDKGVKWHTLIDLNTCVGFDASGKTLRCGYFTLFDAI